MLFSLNELLETPSKNLDAHALVDELKIINSEFGAYNRLSKP